MWAIRVVISDCVVGVRAIFAGLGGIFGAVIGIDRARNLRHLSLQTPFSQNLHVISRDTVADRKIAMAARVGEISILRH